MRESASEAVSTRGCSGRWRHHRCNGILNGHAKERWHVEASLIAAAVVAEHGAYVATILSLGAQVDVAGIFAVEATAKTKVRPLLTLLPVRDQCPTAPLWRSMRFAPRLGLLGVSLFRLAKSLLRAGHGAPLGEMILLPRRVLSVGRRDRRLDGRTQLLLQSTQGGEKDGDESEEFEEAEKDTHDLLFVAFQARRLSVVLGLFLLGLDSQEDKHQVLGILQHDTKIVTLELFVMLLLAARIGLVAVTAKGAPWVVVGFEALSGRVAFGAGVGLGQRAVWSLVGSTDGRSTTGRRSGRRSALTSSRRRRKSGPR